jgi:hypothetical protein
VGGDLEEFRIDQRNEALVVPIDEFAALGVGFLGEVRGDLYVETVDTVDAADRVVEGRVGEKLADPCFLGRRVIHLDRVVDREVGSLRERANSLPAALVGQIQREAVLVFRLDHRLALGDVAVVSETDRIEAALLGCGDHERKGPAVGVVRVDVVIVI